MLKIPEILGIPLLFINIYFINKTINKVNINDFISNWIFLKKKQIIFADVVLENLSLGYNYQNEYPCRNTSDDRFTFTPNRIKKKQGIKIIFNLMIFYSPGPTISHLTPITKILNFVSTREKHPLVDEVYFIITVKCPVLSILLNNPNFQTAQCISHDESYCETVQNMDYHYDFLQYYNSKESVRKVAVIYSNLEQSMIPSEYLESKHDTSIKGETFTGYYAGSLAFYVNLPFYLRIYDFFDFAAKLDSDFNRFKVRNLPLHPYNPLLNSSLYLHGCIFFNDAKYVSTNLFKCVFQFMNSIGQYCHKYYHSTNFYPDEYFNDEVKSIPGAYQIYWLGLYSSIEVKFFTNFYFNFSGGFRENRWGDQQYYLLVLALFSDLKHLSISENNQFCKHREIQLFKTKKF